MTRSFPRIAAATLLAAGGVAVSILVLAIASAKIVIASNVPGIVARPEDVALLDDLVAVSPFIAAFAVADLVAALGLLSGGAWADRVATAVATIATSIGSFAFILVAVGQEPVAVGSRVAATANGLGIIAAFTASFAAVLVLLAVASTPDRTPAPHRWTIPGAA